MGPTVVEEYNIYLISSSKYPAALFRRDAFFSLALGAYEMKMQRGMDEKDGKEIAIAARDRKREDKRRNRMLFSGRYRYILFQSFPHPSPFNANILFLFLWRLYAREKNNVMGVKGEGWKIQQMVFEKLILLFVGVTQPPHAK